MYEGSVNYFLFESWPELEWGGGGGGGGGGGSIPYLSWAANNHLYEPTV